MSCRDCEKEQVLKYNEYYFRIGDGNILIFGCQKHILELQKRIRGEK